MWCITRGVLLQLFMHRAIAQSGPVNPGLHTQRPWMQRHRPAPMPVAHVHGHVEILLPVGCTVTYLTQTGSVRALDGRISVLWGQIPHRVSAIDGDGEILIANLPLSELLSWSMPEVFLARLFAGELVTANSSHSMDTEQFGR